MRSELVTELLSLLGMARETVPLDADADAGPEVAVGETPAAALKLKKSFQDRFTRDPADALAGEKRRLEQLRTVFTNIYSGMADEDRLQRIQQAFGDLVAGYQAVHEALRMRSAMQARLDGLAPAGMQGPLLVPGADAQYTQRLEQLRDAAADAIARASERAELAALQQSVDEVAAERDAVASRVERLQQQADRIHADAAAVAQAREPESPPATLHAESTALDRLLPQPAPGPLTEPVLAAAESALSALRLAADAARAEALALRQMRAVFAPQAAALRQRIGAVLDKVPTKDKRQPGEILTRLGAAEALLAVDASRADTEGFGAALEAVRAEFQAYAGAQVGSGNKALASVAISFLRDELNTLRQAADSLPDLDADTAQCKLEAKAHGAEANRLLGAGSGNQAAKARPHILQLGEVVARWRGIIGPAGLVLDQRKQDVAAVIAAPSPADADPAFAVALESLRATAKKSLAKPLHETHVAEAEGHAAAFSSLLPQAQQDADAARRVAAARLRLDTEKGGLAAVIGAARPAAATELGKRKVQADAAFLRTGMARGMPATAVMHDGLLARLLEVAAEASYADADKTALQDLPEAVREQAFRLCGPALVASLDTPARKSLGAALASDGPAVTRLVEGPLSGRPQVLAGLLSGCGSDGLLALAQALDGGPAAAARAALEGLIDQGRLGDNPAVLAQLVGAPPLAGDDPDVALAKRQQQAKNIGAVKSMAENFAGADGAAALSTLLGDCALGGSDGALASLLQEDGFDGDGAALRGFADAFVGGGEDQQQARAGFARIVNAGGVGAHPKVLGPLAKTAGAAGVKSIGAAFVQPADCANLQGLLAAGGMGGDTSRPGCSHEHPDTLAKVFVDGLQGNGEHLKTFAGAFSGVPGQAKAKEMLDAFNQYPDAYAKQRQPGEGIGRLLGGKQLKGTMTQRIGKLSTQFVPQLRAIGDPAQREKAFRMAPHFDTETAQEGWKPTSPAMKAAGIKSVTASVLKRHKPEAYDTSKTDNVQSMFPPGTDVGDLLDQALRQVSAGRVASQRWPVNLPGPPPTTIEVEIGFLFGDQVNHFGPRDTPPPPHPMETPIFTRAEINAIFAAIK